jgi:hypothetical protein
MNIPVAEIEKLCSFATDNGFLEKEAEIVKNFLEELKEKVTLPTEKEEVEKLYEEYWLKFAAVYPKKSFGTPQRRFHTEQSACKTIFNRSIEKDVHPDDLIEATRKYVESHEQSDYKFIKEMPVYLRNKTWEAWLDDDKETRQPPLKAKRKFNKLD